ncbi:Shedu anti-phage system protein SduA domain-containing protein [Herbidospora sp. NBRC 101105]|uniref:Shedu anti-phage system protein SduA domain-containing protein n=1 Tax=Herbidospora sp. NBRC 101105 TaxID=3032195 RepID=UPI0024A2058E|nr:Shedu anti-phage system protein SduA domain-containing protein [Herbidospora sp. NBRC 101105]GLX94677.1 hypothetical protein Hesp01_26270 [Herbidospora sp. NBRC 101105]
MALPARNKVRSDWTLSQLLRLVHSLAENESVKSAVGDVLDHMGDNYRGGKALLDLIRFAIRQAETGSELESAARLDDALGYATGRLLNADVNEKYRLLSGAPHRNTELFAATQATAHHYLLSIFEDFLRDRPDAGIADARVHFERLAAASIKVVKDREAGIYRVHRLIEENHIWLAETLMRRTTYEPVTDSSHPTSDLPPESLAILARADATLILAGMQHRLRRQRLAEIRSVVEHPSSLERDIQEAFSGAWWLFGGEYIGQSLRRRLTCGLELDIPLLRPDGALHLVELKRANVQAIQRHRTSAIPSDGVHEAVGQVQNYLKLLDENREAVLGHGVDVRRATALVVIGHPHLRTEYTESQVNETLRVYNSHLARIEVITYKQLLDAAERALDLTEPSTAAH